MTKELRETDDRATRVFISYSRKDASIGQWLWETLKARGFDATLDQHDILPGEPWQERLSGLIQAADAVIFYVSPHYDIGSDSYLWDAQKILAEVNSNPRRFREV